MNLEKKIVEQWNTGGFQVKPGYGGFEIKPGTGTGGFQPKPATGPGGFEIKPGTGSGGGFQPKPGTGNPPVATADPFACVLNNDKNHELSADKKSVVYTSRRSGDQWTWYLDHTFTYKHKSGKIEKGTWECNGADEFKIKMEDGDTYDSKTGDWTEVSATQKAGDSSSSSSSSTSKPTFTNTSLTTDDLKAGKVVSKGMKGAVVGEIQKLLIAAGYKNISKNGSVDNRFGSRTKSSVEQFQTANKLKVDGAVGVETINALLNATPASSQSSEDPNKKAFDPNAEEDNSIPSTDGALIKEKEKVLKESLKKMLRNSLLKYS